MGKSYLQFSQKFVFWGVLAAILGSVADVLLLYSPGGGYHLGDYMFYKNISMERLLAGHFLGVLIIPFEIVGLIHVAAAIGRIGKKWSKLLLSLTLISFFGGVCYHATCGFLGAIVLNKGQMSHRLYKDLMFSFRMFSEPLAVVTPIGFVVLTACFIYIILKKDTKYPRWIVFCTPISFYLLIIILYFVFPPVGNFLMPTGFNLSVALFLLCSWYSVRRKGVFSEE